MGPEDKGCYALYMDGVRLGLAEPPEIKMAADAPERDGLRLFSAENTLTFIMKTPKCWRCRSRKRFIKLVMAKGISRNGAVWLANWVRNAGYTYAQAWWPWCWYL